MKKTVLLTGHTGYLGQCLVQLLHQSPDHELRLLTGRLQAIQPASLTVDTVIHCAALRPGPDVTPANLFEHNLTGMLRLLVGLARPTPVLYVSTRMIYGNPSRPQPCNEDDIPQPDTPYGESKWQAEQALRQSGHPAFILRPSALFGVGVASVGRTFIDQLVQRLISGEPIRLYTPDSLRDYLYVWDLARWMLRLIEMPELWPGCLNTSGPQRSIHALTQALLLGLPNPPELVYVPHQGQTADFPEMDIRKWESLRGEGATTSDQQVLAGLRDFARRVPNGGPR